MEQPFKGVLTGLIIPFTSWVGSMASLTKVKATGVVLLCPVTEAFASAAPTKTAKILVPEGT